MLGTVKFFNEEKGYGFIRPKDGGKEMFVHCNQINAPVKKLFQDEDVEYEVGENRGKECAVNVTPIASKKK